jgi:hypothetical protein
MRLLVVEDSALLRKMFGLAFPGQLHELAAGAVDFIDKTTFNVMDLEYLRREVVDRMKALVPNWRANAGAPAPTARNSTLPTPDLSACELCVIGASTGGPAAVQRILQALPRGFPCRSWSCSTCRWDSPVCPATRVPQSRARSRG